jgi:pilus assembly protein CpaE
MSHVRRLAIVDPDDLTREELKSMLLGMDIVWLEAECSRYEFFADVVGQTAPDIGIVAIDNNPDQALKLIETLQTQSPACSILVLSSSSDGQLILRAMRAGAKEFLTLPLTLEELVTAIQRIGNQRATVAGGKTRSSTVIAIAGATGGVGSTSVAVNLSCILARQPENSVVLVDLDLSLGDADVFLDTIPEYTLVDVAQNIQRLDFTLLKRSLTKHSSGLYLLPRPVKLQDAEYVVAEDLQRVVGLLKATFTHLIFDCSKAYRDLDLVALRAADHILMVTQLDLPCLRNMVRLLMSLEEYDGLSEKLKIVVNRAGLESGQISLKKAQETLGRDIFWQLPNDYRTMSEVRNNGVPLVDHAPRAAITQSFLGLVERLTSEGVSTESAPPSTATTRWLGFWPARAK